ncbi:MAG TPA: winged helix-turn-helix domain-containing protein [Thermoanaerobaculia bacterium]|nr:winged helix-turn-helix domain-containing protein [Thermoanaerobaculia bacterium]
MEPAWRIGRFTFEPRRHVLRRDETERRIEPKAAAVLTRLVEGAGGVVTKQELFDAAWPGLIVTDEVLPNAIYHIRRALEDDARSPRYLETIPKVGYRLIAPVEELAEAAPLEARPEAPESRGSTSAPARHRGGAKIAAWAALSAAALVLLSLGPSAWRSDASRSETAARVDPSELVARGWAALDASLPGAGEEAAALATVALEARPSDADAWSLLAASWSARASAGDVAADAGFDQARRAAARALALERDHVPALRVRAGARWLGDWDWRGAETDLLAALEVAPDDARTRASHAELLLMLGRLDEARDSAELAVDGDPDSIAIRLTAALVAWMGDDLELAAEHYRSILDERPGHPVARVNLAKLAGGPMHRSETERLAALTEKERVRPGHLALWFVEADQPEQAFAWLDRAVAERDPTILFFRFDPRWDRWRSDTRYRNAMAAAGLPPAS